MLFNITRKTAGRREESTFTFPVLMASRMSWSERLLETGHGGEVRLKVIVGLAVSELDLGPSAPAGVNLRIAEPPWKETEPETEM